MKISILLPTRQRPANLKRLIYSILDTADKPKGIEIVAYIDDDDDTYDNETYPVKLKTTLIKGPRIVLSETWNRCYGKSKGDILMHCGDDIIFRTKGWDSVVIGAFDEYPDKILFAYGDDGGPQGDFGTHGFIHRKWVETVGYFVPPYFSSDYNDTWLNDVAKMIGRHKRIDIFTEHMHPAFNKAPVDQNHLDRLERHRQDNVGSIYGNTQDERQKDADKLRRVMR